MLHRQVKGSELLLNDFDQPLVVLARYCQRVLDSDYRLHELVRDIDIEWGRVFGERPYFEREGSSSHPDDPYTVESVRGALSALFGSTWPLRVAVLLEAEADRREALHRGLEALCDGGEADSTASEAVRRSLVEALRDGDRPALATRLDRALLGLEQPGRLRAAS